MNNEFPQRDDFAEEIPFHWRNGIPLVVVVAMTVLFSVYNIAIVQPTLTVRYRQICEKNWRLVGLGDAFDQWICSETLVQWADGVSRSAESLSLENDMDSKVRLLEQSYLCLRRLASKNLSDDKLQFEMAVTAAALGHLYTRMPSGTLASENSQSNLARAIALYEVANSTMKQVSRMKGVQADRAYLWNANEMLMQPDQLTSAMLLELSRDIGAISERSSNPLVDRTLAQLLGREFLLLDVERTPDERKEIARRSSSYFIRVISPSIVDSANHAEAMLVSDPASGKAIAWKAVQSFWANKDSDEVHSPRLLAAVFHCLIISSSIAESYGFASKRLVNLSTNDQIEFRRRCASVCIRTLLSRTLQSPQGGEASSKTVALLGLATSLDPDSVELNKLLVNLSDTTNRTDWLEPIRDEIQRERNASYMFMLRAINLAKAKKDDQLEVKEIEEFCSAGDTFASLFSSSTAFLVESKTLDVEGGKRWLKMVNQCAPNVLAAWSYRLKLHLESEQIDEALACLEFLEAKHPSERGAKSIEELKMKLRFKKNYETESNE